MFSSALFSMENSAINKQIQKQSLDELKNTAKTHQSGIMSALVALSKPLMGPRNQPTPQYDNMDYTGYYIAGGVVLASGTVLLLAK